MTEEATMVEVATAAAVAAVTAVLAGAGKAWADFMGSQACLDHK